MRIRQIGRIRLIGFFGVVSGLGMLFFSTKASAAEGELRFLHTDHLGSVTVVSDERGEKVWEGRYLPYGQIFNFQFSIFNYLYTGQERDDETNLYNYNARLYNPRLAQFVAADKLAGTSPAATNRFAYVHGNPLRFIDPSGNAFEAGDGGGGGRSGGRSGGGWTGPEDEVIRPMTLEETLVFQWQEIGLPHWTAKFLAKLGMKDVLGLYFTGMRYQEHREKAHIRALDLFTERLMKFPFTATTGDVISVDRLPRRLPKWSEIIENPDMMIESTYEDIGRIFKESDILHRALKATHTGDFESGIEDIEFMLSMSDIRVLHVGEGQVQRMTPYYSRRNYAAIRPFDNTLYIEAQLRAENPQRYLGELIHEYTALKLYYEYGTIGVYIEGTWGGTILEKMAGIEF